MVEEAPVSGILPNLPARPPTPPRESHNSRGSVSFFSSSISRLFSKDTTPRTPNITPDIPTESPNQASGASRKRVEWASRHEYKDAPTVFSENKSSPHSIQPVLSSTKRRPVKSILKASHPEDIQGTSTKLSPPHTFPNLAAMLESTVQQLAGKDRFVKRDSYITLSEVLKASDTALDTRALKPKMGLLLQFIQRDLYAKTDTGGFDTVLIINALILLSSFLHKQAIADSFTTDFMVFFVDHAIKTFEDPGMSKEVVKHLMFILAKQNFSTKVMTSERVGKLITALQNIEDHMKGKSISVGRINVLRTLLRQSRSHMITNTDWVPELFTMVLSGIAEIRSHAITFGLEASLSLGTESKVSRAVMELFQRDASGTTFAEYYATRLKTMVTKKVSPASVPQIWSVCVLFFRCNRLQLVQWNSMQLWLEIIQTCFNCSDQATKLEANLAWDRFVFAVQPDEKTSPSMISTLLAPLMVQFKRKPSPKTRAAALSSICNLLYYALKPNASPAQLDLYWDSYVAPIVGKMLEITKDSNSSTLAQEITDAISILCGLFDSTSPRPWKDTRAMDSNALEFKELPALDPKWLRRSAPQVFKVLGPIVEKQFWEFANEESKVSHLWKTYITSIASPAIKEIKVSNDTMACVAFIFNMLYKVWQRGPGGLEQSREDSGSGDFMKSFESIITTTIYGLGPLPFTEKLLSIGSQSEFIVIATPSQRHGNTRGEIKCPLHHLFVLFTNPSPNLEYDGQFFQLVRAILSPFFDTRSSSKSKMDLVKDLLQLLPADSTEPSRIIWRVLADFATSAIDIRDETSGGSVDNDQPLGIEYRNIVKILEVGVESSLDEPLPGWKRLFEALITSASIDAGDGGKAIAVIEPLSRTLIAKFVPEKLSNLGGLPYCRTLMSKASYPKDRQTLNAAQRKLWGTMNAGQQNEFDPYSYLYEYVSHCLERAYTAFTPTLAHEYSDVLSAITALLTRCPNTASINALAKLQNGISPWITDKSTKLSGGTPLSQSVISLWGKVCSIIPVGKKTQTHTKILSDLEIMISSGLTSKHRTIVNSTVRMWNLLFGVCEDGLVYPDKVKDALLRLRPIADLQLPFFPDGLEDGQGENQEIPFFSDTQDEPVNILSRNPSLRRQPLTLQPPNQLPKLPNVQFISQVVISSSRSIAPKRSREATPEAGNKRPRKRELTPKLRHDDSQIQFEPIVSSPISDLPVDSQILTDRQKETKERQRKETSAMFPDIRSSSKIRSSSAQITSDAELSLHRPASQPRITSARGQRQSTPILQGHGEDDDFVASSPTPSRSVHNEREVSAPPSSPPEAVNKQRTPSVSVEEWDTTISFPADGSDIAMNSLGPSAQLDPSAFNQNRTISTYQSTPAEQDNRMQADAVSPAHSTSAAENHEEVPVSSSQLLNLNAINTEFLSSPIDDNISGAQQDPKTRTDVFIDALASPIPSEKQTGNDVFEDAISSPGLDDDLPTKSRSPDFDDSSIVRAMAEINDVLNESENHFYSAVDNESDAPSSSDSFKYQRVTDLKKLQKSPRPSGSSMPSLVRKTPGHKKQPEPRNVGSDPENVSNGGKEVEAKNLHTESEEQAPEVNWENLDLEDTIVVEVPDNFNQFSVKNSNRKRVSKATAMMGNKKRRVSEDEESKVPASQKVVGEQPKKPLKKRGRPKRYSQATQSSQATESSQGDGPAASQDNISVDLDSVMEEVRKNFSGHDSFTPHEVRAGEAQIPQTVVVGSDDEEQPRTSDMDVIDETTPDGSFKRESSSVPMNKAERGVEEGTNAYPLVSPSVSGCLSGELVEAEVRVGKQLDGRGEEQPEAQSMRQKLESLIGDLQTATLSYQEVAAFEDLFMDAKEKFPHHHLELHNPSAPQFPQQPQPQPQPSIYHHHHHHRHQFIPTAYTNPNVIPQPTAYTSMDRPKKPTALSATPGLPPQPQVSITHSSSLITAVLPSGESVSILLYGATITSWKSPSGEELLFLSSKASLDGSKPVRGGIPLVFPVFGKDDQKAETRGLKQHGFARTSTWEFLGKSSSEGQRGSEGGDGSVKLDFGLSGSNVSEGDRGGWEGEFGLIYSVTLSREGLGTSLVVRNEGDNAWDFQVLMHTYLRVGVSFLSFSPASSSDISNISLTGLESALVTDKLLTPIQTLTSSPSPLSITAKTDRVYTPAGGPTTPIIVSEGGKKKFTVQRDNLNEVVVWNPWVDASKDIKDFGPEAGYKNMICVEAGSVRGYTKLEPGNMRLNHGRSVSKVVVMAVQLNHNPPSNYYNSLTQAISNPEYAIILSFTLDSVLVLHNILVAYKTWGTLNAQATNCFIYCHSMTGTYDLEKYGLAEVMGRGGHLDTEKYFSSRPLVLDELGVKGVACVLGRSSGGMNVMERTLYCPKTYIGALILTTTTPQWNAWAMGSAEAQRNSIYLDLAVKNGYYEPTPEGQPAVGLATARMISMLTYRSSKSFDRRFGGKFAKEMSSSEFLSTGDLIVPRNQKFVPRMDANCYLHTLRKMDDHDVAQGPVSYASAMSREERLGSMFANVAPGALVIGDTSDILVPPAEIDLLARVPPNADVFMITRYADDGGLDWGAFERPLPGIVRAEWHE
ncbi:hypothetical protein B7494_g3220 [Chlorociboria aeruginascens]|nr:hypothetical protein B7494_g3220 [Chlorociboria aeruginascens]